MRWTLLLVLLLAPLAGAQTPVVGPLLDAVEETIPDQITVPPKIFIPDGEPLVNATIDGAHDPLIHKPLCDVLRADGTPCKIDSDEDGRYDFADNCPDTPNDQADLDGDGEGDACDADRDGDGVANDDDAFPDDPEHWSDRDGDGSPDGVDAFPDDPTEWADTDGDGVGDNSDACAHYDDAADLDGDGLADACDPDTRVSSAQEAGDWSIERLHGLEGIWQAQVASHDGQAIMTFVDGSRHLWFAWNDDGWHIAPIDYMGAFVGESVLTEHEGRPMVAYYRWDDAADDGDLMMAVPGDDQWRVTALDAGPEDRGERLDAAIVDGETWITYAAWEDGAVRVVTPGTAPVVIADGLDASGGSVDVAVIDGTPTVAFTDWWEDSIFVATFDDAWTTQEIQHNTSLGGVLAMVDMDYPMLAWDCFDCDAVYMSGPDGAVQHLDAGMDVRSIDTIRVGDVPVLAFVGDGLHVAADTDNFTLHQVSQDAGRHVGLSIHATDLALAFGGDAPQLATRDIFSWLGARACGTADDDGDGVGNNCDANPHDGPLGDVDGDGVTNQDDACDGHDDLADRDDDGTPDGCDADRDGDGVANEDDALPDDASETRDRDRDGVGDNADNCRRHANPDQSDLDGDGRGDVCDRERDGDSYRNSREDKAGSDPDDPDSMPDKDGDGVHDKADNCRNHSNPDQGDLDGDGRGDECDNDTDGDGYPDKKERKKGSDPRDASSMPRG